MKVVDLLLGYKDIKLKITMLESEKEVLNESLEMVNVLESEDERIKSESLQAVSWDRELIVGGVKIADEKINRIIGSYKNENVMNVEEVGKRIKAIDFKLKQLERLLKMIDGLLDSLNYDERFVLYNHYIEGMTFDRVAELHNKEFKLYKSDSSMRWLKRKAILKLQDNFNKL